jgi:hypothetical protein
MPTNTAGTTARHYVSTHQVHYLRRRISWADGNSTVYTLGVIPAYATVIRGGVVVTTAFNSGTNNFLDIGTAADDDGFATDLALGTIGVISADEMATTNDAYVTADTTIIATVALTGTQATAGEGFAWVEYLVPDGDGTTSN